MRTTAAAVLFGFLYFLAGHAFLLAYPNLAEEYFYSGPMAGVTHLFTLGWVSLLIAGVLRQLTPFGFQAELRRPRLAGVSVAIWIPSIALMALGLGGSFYALIAAGVTGVFLGAMLLLAVYLPPFAARGWDLPGLHVLMALVSLGVAAGIGLWMGLAKALDAALPVPYESALYAHLHLAGAGWAGGMIIGVTARLFPHPHLERPRSAAVRCGLFAAGLAGLAVALWTGAPHAPFGLMLAAAMVWYAGAFIPAFRRFRQPGDGSTGFLVMAWLHIAAAALIGALLALGVHLGSPAGLRLQWLYGFLYIIGGLSMMILGMLYRIVPTHVSKLLTARGVQGGRVRRVFVDPGTQRRVLLCLCAGVVVASVGILGARGTVFLAGWSVWSVGVALYAASLFRMGRAVRRLLASG